MDDLTVYLDNFASTPLDPRVAEEFFRSSSGEIGNPNSTHAYGARRQRQLEAARARVRSALGAVAGDVVFTSGATEANNLALAGLLANPPSGRHAVIGSIEHASVLECVPRLRNAGWRVDIAPATAGGTIDAHQVEALLRPDTSIVSVMGVNNELGTIQPIGEIGELVRGSATLFHCDLSQAVGKIELSSDEAGIDLATVSGHKVYGPQGVGALYISPRAAGALTPLFVGGGQELGLRSGTQNVAGCAALGLAMEIAVEDFEADFTRISSLRDQLAARLEQAEIGFVRHLSGTRQVAGILHGRIDGMSADVLQSSAPRLAISQGSACHAGSGSPSDVLAAIGMSESMAEASLRLSLGRFTSQRDIDVTVQEIVAAVRDFRNRMEVAA